jgi:RNA polymerase sigma-70 factor (ECF subfamily)
MIKTQEIAAALGPINSGSMAEISTFERNDEDAALMLRFKSGDADAFDQLFKRHARPLINFAYRFVRNRGRAEELAQEVLLKVYESADGYRAKAKFTTWLYRIAVNICLNEVRRPAFRAIHQSLPLEDLKTGVLTPPELQSDPVSFRNLDRQAMSQALKQALSEIPEKQRTAFILNKYQELSYAEVGEIMKISEKAVKSLIHRAREALAERLASFMPKRISE